MAGRQELRVKRELLRYGPFDPVTSKWRPLRGHHTVRVAEGDSVALDHRGLRLVGAVCHSTVHTFGVCGGRDDGMHTISTSMF